MEIKNILIGVVILIALFVVFVPVISQQVAVGADQRACLTDGYQYECLDNDDGLINWCSNETPTAMHCLNASYPVYNATYQLCTNASGVKVVNLTATSVCDSIGWANGIKPYTNVGLSVVEVTLLGLITLFIALSIIFGIVKGINPK